MSNGQRVIFPVAHGEGNYFADDETLDRLEGEGRVAFRYAEGDNPNGSARNIAGILSEKRNVLGLMPHPERVCDPLLGGTDGARHVPKPDRSACHDRHHAEIVREHGLIGRGICPHPSACWAASPISSSSASSR